MTPINVRSATMDDVQQIVTLFCRRVDAWQRIGADGRAEAVDYGELTLYERWLHGTPTLAGAWMSVETGALLLSYLILQGGIGLVAEDDGAIIGYLEAYLGDEPPHGKHAHILHLLADNDAVRLALLDGLKQASKRRIMVTLSSYDQAGHAFYGSAGLGYVSSVEQYTLIAQSGRGFYQATEHLNPNVQQIQSWPMPIGRIQSAVTHWHLLWPGIWDAIAPIRAHRVHRLQISASGHDAFVGIRQDLFQDRTAEVSCWSAKPLTSQLLVAIRDWTYREGYRTLILTVSPETAKVLTAEAETTPYKFDIYATSS
jgi:hypothetical protein